MGLCCCVQDRKSKRIAADRFITGLDIKPLDLVFFRGKNLVSRAISKIEDVALSKSKSFSHVGIVVNTDCFPITNGEPGRLYIWESVLSGGCYDQVPDVQTGKCFFGSQIRDLADVLYACSRNNDTVFVASLSHKIDLPSSRSHLEEAYRKFHHLKYDCNLSHCCKAICSACCVRCYKCICACDTRSAKRVFCSELVVSILQVLGVIAKDLDPETIAPMELIDSKFIDLGSLRRVV